MTTTSTRVQVRVDSYSRKGGRVLKQSAWYDGHAAAETALITCMIKHETAYAYAKRDEAEILVGRAWRDEKKAWRYKYRAAAKRRVRV